MAQTREQLVDFCRKVYTIHAASVGLECLPYTPREILRHKKLTGGQKHYMIYARRLLWPEVVAKEDAED